MPRNMFASALRPPPPPASARSPWLAAALLAAVTLAAYANSFSVPFLFDDHESIEANPTIKHLSAWGQVLSPPSNGSGVTGRPLVNFSLALNYAFSGTSVRGYHLTNVALHLLAGLALFGVVRRTLSLAALRDRFGERSTPLALIIAAGWLVHPLQTESVTCIVQRTEVLVGLWYFVTFYCFLRGVDEAPWLSGGRERERVVVRPLAHARSHQKGSNVALWLNRTPSRFWPAAMVGSCLLGMASKEVMVSAPLMLLLFDRTFVAESFHEAWRQRRPWYLALAGTWVLLALLVLKFGGTRGGAAGLGLGVSPFAYALKQCEAIPHYLRLAFWPHPLVLDYGETLAVHRGLIGFKIALLVVLVAGTLIVLVRRPMLGFLGFWFFAILAPSSSVIPLLTQTVAEHRMYLPLAAVVVLAILAVEPWLQNRGGKIALAGIAVLALLSARRNHDYRDGVGLWRDNVVKTPLNSRAHYNLGVELARLPGRSADAMAAFRRSLDCKPTDAAAHYGLAHELAAQPGGKLVAIAHYEEALRIIPHHLAARINLANELTQQPGRLAEGIRHYEIAILLHPDSSMAHNNLANELAKLPGFEATAIEHYQQAIRIRPEDPDPRFNLGNLLARQPGRILEAVPQYREAVRLRPNLTGAHFNLAVIYANHGHRTEAIRHFERVVEIDPASAAARENLALLRGLGR